MWSYALQRSKNSIPKKSRALDYAIDRPCSIFALVSVYQYGLRTNEILYVLFTLEKELETWRIYNKEGRWTCHARLARPWLIVTNGRI